MKPIDSQPAPDPWALSAGVRGFARETYEASSSLLPELDIFGWLRFHTTLTGGLEPDRHPEAFEIHCMVRGHLLWWVENEQQEFSTGKIFIVRPNELHGGAEGSIQPCEHYWMRIRFPKDTALPSLSLEETDALRTAFEAIQYRTFVTSPEVKDYFEKLLEEHRHQTSIHSSLIARSILHALLVTILRDHDLHLLSVKIKPLLTWHVRRTLQWLEGKIFDNEVCLDAVAANVGMSPAGLRARFKAETGYTLHEYQIHLRVKEAQRRLSNTSDDVTSIAHALGFSSSQYFATVFRRETGMTPGNYRKSHPKDVLLPS